MFDELTSRLEGVFRTLRGRGRLSESNIEEALKEVRRALLEADVNFRVVRDFIARIKEKSLGQAVLKSITPGQQVIKIVHDELVELLGREHETLSLSGSPAVILMVGLQGSGKTTACAKLALHLRKNGRKPVLVGADVYRPAAKDQLGTLAESLAVPCYTSASEPVEIAREAAARAPRENWDTVIVDTAGRLHIDETLMAELVALRKAVKPVEILYVADAMSGQEALRVAETFHAQLGLTGILFAKIDGDARGGAALSIRAVTGIPIKFLGTGEKPSDFEVFHSDRLASRILGMGDVVTLVEKAQETVDVEEAEKLALKLQKDAFTFEDFLTQLRQLRKMGPLSDLLGMIPGFGRAQLKGLQVDDGALVRVEAMIQSMTPEERRRPDILNGSRRKRIARGSGTSVQEVNRLLKQFAAMQKMVKGMAHGKLLPGFDGSMIRPGF
jgi:signal recognition particle subunit SRP54